jgi:hypothetical protein
MLIRIRLASGGSKLIRWLRHEWKEMNYAQRRLFEMQTEFAVSADAHTSQQQQQLLIAELEAVYSLPALEPGHELQ